jgi:hypothetical protein
MAKLSASEMAERVAPARSKSMAATAISAIFRSSGSAATSGSGSTRALATPSASPAKSPGIYGPPRALRRVPPLRSRDSLREPELLAAEVSPDPGDHHSA